MPSKVFNPSLGDKLFSRISESNTDFHKGHKLKRRWLDAFVRSAEGNRFISEEINTLQQKENSSEKDCKVSGYEVKDVEEDIEHDEEPLTEPFVCDDVETQADDDMFDDWMPNNGLMRNYLEENESLATNDDLNDPTLQLEYDVKIKVMENTEIANHKKQPGKDVAFIETKFSCEIPENPFQIIHSVALTQKTAATGLLNLKKTGNRIKRKDTNHYMFQCNICQDKFKTKRVQTRHNDRFGASGCIKPFQCRDCDKSYKTPEQLISHNNYCSGKNYECIICHKFYPNASQLRYHQMLHASVNRFPCTECGKGFKRPSDLKTHKRIHMDEQKFKCDVCNKGFKFSGQVIKHKTTHIEKRPFSCSNCEQTFKTSTNLARHRRTHETDRPFSCNICGIKLKCRFYLEQHKETHNGKIHKCPVCSKSFAVKSYLKAHMRRVNHKQVSKKNSFTDDFNITDTLLDMEYA